MSSSSTTSRKVSRALANAVYFAKLPSPVGATAPSRNRHSPAMQSAALLSCRRRVLPSTPNISASEPRLLNVLLRITASPSRHVSTALAAALLSDGVGAATRLVAASTPTVATRDGGGGARVTMPIGAWVAISRKRVCASTLNRSAVANCPPTLVVAEAAAGAVATPAGADVAVAAAVALAAAPAVLAAVGRVATVSAAAPRARLGGGGWVKVGGIAESKLQLRRVSPEQSPCRNNAAPTTSGAPAGCGNANAQSSIVRPSAKTARTPIITAVLMLSRGW